MSKLKGCFRWIFYTTCGLIIGLALIVFFGDSPTETSATQPTSAPTAAPTAGPTPTFEQSISSALGERNREAPVTIRNESGVIIVEWPINDNLSGSMIKTGAMMDTVDILRAIHESGVEYQLISLAGTFALVDKFGNSSESPVIWLDMSKETMSKINWTDKTFVDSLLYKRLPEIADRLKYHPAIEN